MESVHTVSWCLSYYSYCQAYFYIFNFLILLIFGLLMNNNRLHSKKARSVFFKELVKFINQVDTVQTGGYKNWKAYVINLIFIPISTFNVNILVTLFINIELYKNENS
jgi:hypothetical protein